MSVEFRVLWRREHDKTLRRRLYQTRQGAEDFARVLEIPPDDAYHETYALKLWEQLGDIVDIRIEQRAEIGRASCRERV